jgi:hypothetical protein
MLGEAPVAQHCLRRYVQRSGGLFHGKAAEELHFHQSGATRRIAQATNDPDPSRPRRSRPVGSLSPPVPVALAYGWLRSVDDQDKFRLRLELWPQNRAVLYEGTGGLPTRTSGPRRTLAYCGQKFTNKRYITMIRSRRAVQVLLLTGIIASGAFAAPIAYNINFTTKY